MNGIILACFALLASDGDTPKCDGVLLRDMGPGQPNISGFDAPEIGKANCDRERGLGFLAKARYQELLDQPGTKVIDSGKRDQWKRPLVWVMLADGTPAGTVMMNEGHAVAWPNEMDWCR